MDKPDNRFKANESDFFTATWMAKGMIIMCFKQEAQSHAKNVSCLLKSKFNLQLFLHKTRPQITGTPSKTIKRQPFEH